MIRLALCALASLAVLAVSAACGGNAGRTLSPLAPATASSSSAESNPSAVPKTCSPTINGWYDLACRVFQPLPDLTAPIGFRITGVEGLPFVLKGHNLRASYIASNGLIVGECADQATWTSSDPEVITLTAVKRGGVDISGTREGDATISVTCGSLKAELPLRRGHYTVSGRVRSTSGPLISGAAVAMGSFSKAILTDAGGAFTMDVDRRPISFWGGAAGYFANTGGGPQWNLQTTQSFDLSLDPISHLFTTGKGVLNAGAEERISFTVPRSTSFFFLPVWTTPEFIQEGGYIQQQLTCNGAPVSVYDTNKDPFLGGFFLTVNTSCQYEITLWNRTSAPVVNYQYTMTLR